jgi:hypothetical protein
MMRGTILSTVLTHLVKAEQKFTLKNVSVRVRKVNVNFSWQNLYLIIISTLYYFRIIINYVIDVNITSLK